MWAHLLALLVGFVGALLPARWRERLGLEHALPIGPITIASGAVELALGAILIQRLVVAEGEPRPLSAIVALGLCLEGLARAVAGVTGHGLGLVSLWALDELVQRASRERGPWGLPELDRVERLSDGYRIRSTLDHGWDARSTVEVHGYHWRVVEEAHDRPEPYRHEWTLGPLPPGWVGGGAPIRYEPGRHRALARRAHDARVEDVRAFARELARPPRLDPSALFAILLAPFVSLLGARTRSAMWLGGVPVVLATFLTGLVEVALSSAAYPFVVARYGVGSLATTAVVVLFIEGLARTTSGFVGLPCGTLLGWALERLVLGPKHAFMDLRKLPPIHDELVPIDGGWEIRSCRARSWGELATLLIEGAPHRIVSREERVGELRPWIYRLAPTPNGWVDRERIEYTRELVLREEPRRERDARPE